MGVEKLYAVGEALRLQWTASSLKSSLEKYEASLKLWRSLKDLRGEGTTLNIISLVHIASHFQILPGNETSSFLLLGDGTHLTLAQIKSAVNLFGGVEMLTLSACDTATGGTTESGKEVEGFAVLAQRQGAKAVIATLWAVADESTRLLMQKFYRLREAGEGTLKAEALRQAQLALLRGDEKQPGKAPYAHPYFWAPFILIGNWK